VLILCYIAFYFSEPFSNLELYYTARK
jgi:hypothetical protein